MQKPDPTVEQLFFDAQCTQCRRAAQRLGAKSDEQLQLIAIGEAGEINGIPGRAALRRQLHLRTAEGMWLTGLDAAVRAWSHTSYRWLVRPLQWPLLVWITRPLYDRLELRRYRRLYGCADCDPED